MEKFIVLGIDQGLASCGIGILEFIKTKKEIKPNKILFNKTLKTTAKIEMSKRLVYLKDEIQKIIDKYKPICISCEHLFYSTPGKGQRKKSSSILTTNMVTGIIYLLAGMNNIKIIDYVPGTVKKIITGNGKATKEMMKEGISNILNLNEEKKDEHQIDSLCIAYTCGIKLEFEKDLTLKKEENNYE